MEIELNFRLDGNRRTAHPNPTQTPETSGATIKELNYQSKTVMTNLAQPLSDSSDHEEHRSHRRWLDDVLFDCQISDSGLMPRTFWVPANGMAPRCQLEQLALDVFHAHVPEGLEYDAATSGAEWWAQLRPSPTGTGRYSMHDDQPDPLSTTGISFHWDKDEDLRLLMGGTTNIHPHLSTVTYLTDLGGPTLALNFRVDSLTGEWLLPGSDDDTTDAGVEGFVSWPRTGKHMSFDGRYLHAAPADLMEPGAFANQTRIPSSNGGDPIQQKKLQRRHRRVTFLVNVWLNYKPFDIKPFPETMIDKMSGTDQAKRKRLQFQTSAERSTEDVTVTTAGGDSGNSDMERFRWPMGDCDSKEFIEAEMPIATIRKQAATGGNVRIQWNTEKNSKEPLARLFKEKIDEPASIQADASAEKKRPTQTEDKTDDTKRQKA